MATDRDIIKIRQVGQADSYGLAGTARAAISAIHQDVITFEVGADATIAEMGQRTDKAFIVKSVHFTGATGLAVSGSAYVSLLAQKRDGAGGSPVTVASVDTNTAGSNVPIVAFVPLALVLTVTPADLTFAAGNVLTFKLTETSTPTTPIGKVTFVVEYI